MHVEQLVGHRTDRFDDQGTDGDIGDEMTVHDVHMHPVAAALVDGADLIAQPREIGRENGGGDLDGWGGQGKSPAAVSAALLVWSSCDSES